MHTFKKTLVAAALVSTGAVAQAEVSGSVGIATSYLFRGLDLSAGSAVVSGSLDYASEAGIYAGIWGSSGDDSYGTEYDVYLGWGGDITESVSLDIAYVDYNYPSCPGGPDNCDFEEAVVGLGFGPVGITWAHNLDSDVDYDYYAIGYEVSDFSFTYGMVDGNGADYSHFDASYAMGDLGFTLSRAFDDGFGANEETQFVVSYSIPIE